MKCEAWEAINSAVNANRDYNHQVISDAVVEYLHKAGFVIVPHEADVEMKMNGEMLISEKGSHAIFTLTSDIFETMIKSNIQKRQESE